MGQRKKNSPKNKDKDKESKPETRSEQLKRYTKYAIYYLGHLEIVFGLEQLVLALT